MEKIAREDLEKEIRSIVAGIMEIEEAKVVPDAKFVEELGMDSMMALEMLAAVEKKYKIKIPEDYLTKIDTLNSVIAMADDIVNKG